MLLVSVIKCDSLLLVQWCLFLPISFFISDVTAWQAHALTCHDCVSPRS